MNVLNLTANEEARFFRQQVAELRRRNVDCRTLSVPGEHDADSAETRSVGQYLRFYPPVLRHALDGYDIVHANYGLTGPAALAQPKPSVLSLWGTDLYGRFGPVSKLCARLADAVIVMSEPMAEELDQPCHVIPHGVNVDLFSPSDQQAAQAELGWDHDRLHVLFPYSTTTEVKDYPRAERVVAAAAERLDVPVELQTVAGEPHERMPIYMNAADSLLLTSKWEGSPNSPKEAMACNLPVVATDVGDVADQLRGVSHSHVCETDEELVDALVSVLEAGEPSDGRERAREYSLEAMGRRIIAVYDDVLD
jgi:glycosyltransferase involved in cell wall biosynthesis